MSSENSTPTYKRPLRKIETDSSNGSVDWDKWQREHPRKVWKGTFRVLSADQLDLGPLNHLVPPGTSVFFPPLHSSSIPYYQTCRRRFLYGIRLCLKRRVLYRPALEVGKIYHEVIASMLAGNPLEESIACARDVFVDKLARIENTQVNKYNVLRDGTSWKDYYNRAMEDFHKAAAMAAVQFAHYPPSADLFRVYQTEMGGIIKVKGYRFPISGKIDLVLEHRKTGHLWIQDHKSTSQPPVLESQALSFDIQLELYRLILETLTGRPVSGMIYDIIRKQQIKYCPDTKDKEGFFQSYIPRLAAQYQAKTAAALQTQKQVDLPILRSRKEFDAPWMAPDLWDTAVEVGIACVTYILRNFPRVGCRHVCTRGCFGTKCEFLPLCNSEPNPSKYQEVWKSNYIQQPREDDRNEYPISAVEFPA